MKLIEKIVTYFNLPMGVMKRAVPKIIKFLTTPPYTDQYKNCYGKLKIK